MVSSRISGSLVLGCLGLLMGACTSTGPAAPDIGDLSPPPPPPAVPPAPPPISGGTLLVLRDQKTAVVSDPDRDRVYVVDLVGHKRSAVVTLEPGAEPGRLVEDSDGRVHLALRGAGAVLTVDPRDGKTLARRSLCAAPRGLAFESATQLLHVACAGGELVSIAPLAEKPSRTLQLDRDLRDVLVQGSRLLVSTFRKADLLVVDASGIVERSRPEKTQSVFSRNKFGRMFPGSTGGSISSEPDASPAIAYRMVAGPSDSVMMVHQRGMDSEVGTQPGGYGDGTTCTGIVESAVTAFGMGATTSVKSSAAMANAVLPVDLAVSPDGRSMALVAAGHAGTDRQLQFFSMSDVTEPPKPGDPCIDGGTVPPPGGGGMTPPPTDPPAPIDYRPPNGDVIAVAFDGAGNILVQTREPAATLQILTQRVPAIVLADDSRADLGHQLFHAATKGQLSCASCHAEGAEDGRKWTFAGIGTRRTQSLRGGVMDTAPFHWNGELRNFETLMHDVFQGRMGGGAVDRPHMDALVGWVDKVPGLKLAPKGHDDSAVDRGRSLFSSAAVGCATCHTGSDFTNGNSYDVGTGGTFQVPQLHSLAARAPYMHDGCATTLADRFGTKCGGDLRHGNTSQLTPAEIGDLIAYLESL
jgi:mono/diheme cytochrome c family protein